MSIQLEKLGPQLAAKLEVLLRKEAETKRFQYTISHDYAPDIPRSFVSILINKTVSIASDRTWQKGIRITVGFEWSAEEEAFQEIFATFQAMVDEKEIDSPELTEKKKSENPWRSKGLYLIRDTQRLLLQYIIFFATEEEDITKMVNALAIRVLTYLKKFDGELKHYTGSY
jgi:hypothetical protein